MPKIDIDTHLKLADEGYLQINKHPELPLMIHNYSQKTQYEKYWRQETLISRGLVTDFDGNIIARPFGKFFNLDEHIGLFGDLPEENFEVYEKMDGSLGIIFFYNDQLHIATRGSFFSDQAIAAKAIFELKYGNLTLDKAHTYLVEIIYPENRIVVNYGDTSDLVLLGIMETKTGREIPLFDFGLPNVKRYDGIRNINEIRSIQADDREGFVIRFQSGLRVKVKFDEYVRLHRILTGVNSRVIWEELRAGRQLEGFLENVPDEFYAWVKKTVASLNESYEAIEKEAKTQFKHFEDRKLAAEYYFKETKYPPIMFKMLDQRPYDEIIWKMIRPENLKAFSEEGENE